MTPFFFAYGTLRPDVTGALGKEQRARLQVEAEVVGPAHVTGQMILMGDYPGLIEGDGRVLGVIYQLKTPSDTLAWLDAYEGVRGQSSDEYQRVAREAQGNTGASVSVWFYLLKGFRIPNRHDIIHGGDWSTVIWS